MVRRKRLKFKFTKLEFKKFEMPWFEFSSLVLRMDLLTLSIEYWLKIISIGPKLI